MSPAYILSSSLSPSLKTTETHKPDNQIMDQVVIVIDEENPRLKQMVQEDLRSQVPQALARTKTLQGRVCFTKPNSRFTEINYPIPSKPIRRSEDLQPFSNSGDSSSSSSTDHEDEEEAEENRMTQRKLYRANKKRKRINRRGLFEWTLFLILMTCLLSSLTLKPLKNKVKWGLKIWTWCVMGMVIFCGRLVSGWVMGLVVFFIERKEKVLYFGYGLRRSMQNCLWLALVLMAWMTMFPNINHHNSAVKKVFRALVAILIGTTIWLIKIVLVKVLASSFHVATFFERMKGSVFHHYVLEALSGPPLEEEDEDEEDRVAMAGSSRRRRIHVEKLRKVSMESKGSAWSVKRLVRYVRRSGLSTVSRTVDDFGKAESEIISEWEARNRAHRIFKNVAKLGAKFIEVEDLLRFMKKEEVHTIFPLFEGALETGKITKSSFRNWVVQAYIERKSLAHSLNDTKTAVLQLHKLASAVVIVIIIVLSLLVMGLATTKVMLLVTSQLLLVGFMFQNTCKTVFESIIFVFVMHPFDVGDRCVVDGVQMVVEEMNILSTVFLRYDMEKIYYPNTVLLTKPISNFRRSPDMADSVDFSIDVSTSVDGVNALKKAIQTYIQSKPKYWSPKHSVIVKEIESEDKMKMVLSVQHTMNHQNFAEKSARRSELVFELKKIFEGLGIKCHLLPQTVHLAQLNMDPP